MADKKGKSTPKSTWTERRRDNSSNRVAVYSELSMTVEVYDNNFVKITFGHERFSPSDSEADLERTEKKAYKFNERAVDRHVRKVTRLVRRIREAGE